MRQGIKLVVQDTRNVLLVQPIAGRLVQHAVGLAGEHLDAIHRADLAALEAVAEHHNFPFFSRISNGHLRSLCGC
jgi:hypothetical protein